jgi:hypothetical protein
MLSWLYLKISYIFSWFTQRKWHQHLSVFHHCSAEAGVTMKPMKMYSLLDSTLEIQCGIPETQPPSPITWELEGQPVTPDQSRVKFLDNARTLWISPVQSTDLGRYSCKSNGEQWLVYVNGYRTGETVGCYLKKINNLLFGFFFIWWRSTYTCRYNVVEAIIPLILTFIFALLLNSRILFKNVFKEIF